MANRSCKMRAVSCLCLIGSACVSTRRSSGENDSFCTFRNTVPAFFRVSVFYCIRQSCVLHCCLFFYFIWKYFSWLHNDFELIHRDFTCSWANSVSGKRQVIFLFTSLLLLFTFIFWAIRHKSTKLKKILLHAKNIIYHLFPPPSKSLDKRNRLHFFFQMCGQKDKVKKAKHTD